MNEADEINRVRAEYERRERDLPKDFYANDKAANLFALHSRERALRQGLADAGLLPLTGRTLLEVGCGTGEWFPTFERFGLTPQNLSGVELAASRLAQAQARSPRSQLLEGDATELPFNDGTFDVVFQATVLSSILDDSVRATIAKEMLRVRKPGGAVISYDFAFNNPSNKAVRRVTRDDLTRLFPGCRATFIPCTLAPPVARRLVPLSWVLAEVLQASRALNTHLLAVIRPE